MPQFDQRKHTAATLTCGLGQAAGLAEGGHDKLMLQRGGTGEHCWTANELSHLMQALANNPGLLDYHAVIPVLCRLAAMLRSCPASTGPKATTLAGDDDLEIVIWMHTAILTCNASPDAKLLHASSTPRRLVRRSKALALCIPPILQMPAACSRCEAFGRGTRSIYTRLQCHHVCMITVQS
jgi:hypothetical protein